MLNRSNIQDLVRRVCRSDSTYAYLRRCLLLTQKILRIPDDPDYVIFKFLAQSKIGLIIDVGANGGQSAIAFSFLCPSYQIQSFEPNPALWPELDFVKRLLGARYTYHPVGLGAEPSTLKLYVPVSGGLAITTRASVQREAAKAHLEALTSSKNNQGRIEEVEIEIVRFDDLGLSPDAIKIDVEGHELSVLQGMERTIQRCRPVFLIEQNPDAVICQKLLSLFDYRFFWYHANESKLKGVPTDKPRNWFAIPSEKLSEFGLFGESPSSF